MSLGVLPALHLLPLCGLYLGAQDLHFPSSGYLRAIRQDAEDVSDAQWVQWSGDARYHQWEWHRREAQVRRILCPQEYCLSRRRGGPQWRSSLPIPCHNLSKGKLLTQEQARLTLWSHQESLRKELGILFDWNGNRHIPQEGLHSWKSQLPILMDTQKVPGVGRMVGKPTCTNEGSRQKLLQKEMVRQ